MLDFRSGYSCYILSLYKIQENSFSYLDLLDSHLPTQKNNWTTLSWKFKFLLAGPIPFDLPRNRCGSANSKSSKHVGANASRVDFRQK